MSSSVDAALGTGPSGGVKPRRILLVDDSISALAAISSVLEDQGFEVLTASGGQAGLDAFTSAQADLVILDIFMPEVDGLAVCRGIRAMETDGKTPILFLTADENPQTQVEAIRAEGDDLILKSALHRELVIRVQALLRQRRLQEVIRAERDSLRVAQRNRELLTRFIVHDLKNPLQSLEMLVEALEMSLNHPGQTSARIENLREVIGTMTRMIQDLLDSESAQDAGMVLHPELFALLPQVRRWVEESLEPALSRKHQSLHMDIPEDLVLEADAELWRRCFINLVDNASKYGPRDSLIEIRAQVVQGWVELQVVDQGPGVPTPFKERVFDLYFRLDEEASKTRISNGLGLAFCRQVVEAHGGKIWVSDNLPKGSVFNIRVPCLGPLA
jgi:signal transduction histidine kinase